jgi:hypothetical protein
MLTWICTLSTFAISNALYVQYFIAWAYSIAPDPPIVSRMTPNPHVITLIGLDPSALRVTLTAPDPEENDPWVLLQNGGFCNGCITERHN